VTEIIKAGASGYLFAEDAYRLPAAVREMIRGGVPMSPPVSRLVMGRARRSSSQMAAVRPATVNVTDLVTDRQREILNLLANGHSYDDIGVALDLSVNTVRSHVRILYERLGVSTKVEAVVVALELGLVERPPAR
jgi:DNA-binding NarL/FixJ family response regulator